MSVGKGIAISGVWGSASFSLVYSLTVIGDFPPFMALVSLVGLLVLVAVTGFIILAD